MKKLNTNGFSHGIIMFAFVVIFAIAGVGYIVASHASTPIVGTAEAELMTVPSGGSVYTSSSASAGKAIKLTTSGVTTGHVSLSDLATTVSIKAYGSSCHGTASLSLGVDGVAAVSVAALATSGWTTYSGPVNLPAGNHNLSVNVSNAGKGKNCYRNAYVDVVVFNGSVSPPAPTVTLSANPTDVPSGSNSSLTWSSTNASSCNASGAWSGSEPTSGSASTSAITSTSTYNLNCTGAGGTANASVTTNVMAASGPPKLRWSPPSLVNPITVTLGTGRTESILDNTRDYIIVLPATKKIGPTIISGGHNVVIKGGYVTVAPGDSGAYCNREALCIRDNVGTVHIEGVLVDNSAGGSDFDAINIKSPQSIVQIENVRANGLTGQVDGTHADVVQPWGGVKELRIDRVSGTSDYQGLFLQPEPAYSPIGPVTLSNIDLVYQSAVVKPGSYQLVWLAYGCNTPASVSLNEVYVVPKAGATIGEAVYPDIYSQSGCAPTVSQNTVTWPLLPTVTGMVKLGPPAAGSFVPEGLAGNNYQSPGY